MEGTAHLDTIEPSKLTPMVRSALRRRSAEIVDWTATVLHEPVSIVTGGVYRLAGTANDGGEVVPWSLVLKIVLPAQAMSDPRLDQYWKREVLAYESGFLRHLPDALVAPVCYGVDAQSDGRVWLWLEDIHDDGGRDWPIERIRSTARHLGIFNGTYPAEVVPDAPWVGRGFLRSWVSQGVTRIGVRLSAEEQMELLTDARRWDVPAARAIFPTPIVDRLLRVWENRERLLAAVERLPQLLRHGDADARNLFTRHRAPQDHQTVAVDWAFLGLGGVGEEAGHFATFSAARTSRGRSAKMIDRAIFDGYRLGLQQAGRQDDRDLVRFGYAAHAALRWSFRPAANVLLAIDRAQDARSAGALSETSIPPWVTFLANSTYFALDRADEALSLLGRP